MMPWTIILLLLALPATQTPAPPAHDKAFWRAVVADSYTPPASADLPALVRELSGYLASPDPELRDDIAYSTLANWIYRKRIVEPGLRRELMAAWIDNLGVGIGDRGTDMVFRRSFSALGLGILTILDNEAPYLERAEFDRLLQAALTYLRDERDVRGFDPGTGWMHSVAHTADLLKFLARSRYLQPSDQAAILTSIADKLGKVDEVLTHGEDERLARAVLSIVAHDDFDAAGFRTWIASIAKPGAGGPPTPASLAAGQNRTHLLVSLFAVLSIDPRDLASIREARGIVLDALRTP
jgi:hypothetical protein